MIFQHLPLNEKGRDFIVGDIHGSFDILINAMHKLKFDVTTDRLFSVGDLIDRGPSSSRCIKFLDQPFVHAVRGNHEDMLLDLYANGEPDPAVLQYVAQFNGFSWWLSIDHITRDRILTSIRKLPYAIQFDTTRGSVGLIHADVPPAMDWQTFVRNLKENKAYARETCLWGRSRIEQSDNTGVKGIGRLFVGHTPQWGNINRFGNIYAVDTGAVYGVNDVEPSGKLSVVNALARTHVILEPEPTLLLNIKDEDTPPAYSFSDYTI